MVVIFTCFNVHGFKSYYCLFFQKHQNTADREELVTAGFIVSGKDKDGLQKLHIDNFIGTWNIFHKFELNNTSKLVLYTYIYIYIYIYIYRHIYIVVG